MSWWDSAVAWADSILDTNETVEDEPIDDEQPEWFSFNDDEEDHLDEYGNKEKEIEVKTSADLIGKQNREDFPEKLLGLSRDEQIKYGRYLAKVDDDELETINRFHDILDVENMEPEDQQKFNWDYRSRGAIADRTAKNHFETYLKGEGHVSRMDPELVDKFQSEYANTVLKMEHNIPLSSREQRIHYAAHTITQATDMSTLINLSHDLYEDSIITNVKDYVRDNPQFVKNAAIGVGLVGAAVGGGFIADDVIQRNKRQRTNG